MVVLTGRYEHTLDPKNRLFIPAKLRDKLGETFTVCRAPCGTPCLYIYRDELWDNLCDRIFSLPETTHNQELQSRMFDSVQSDCKPDSQGRLTLAPDLVAYAGLKHDVIISGAGKRVEIWDKDTFIERRTNPIPVQNTGEENFGIAF